MKDLMRDTALDALLNAFVGNVESMFPYHEWRVWNLSSQRKQQNPPSTNASIASSSTDDIRLPEKAASARPGLKRRATTAKEPLQCLSVKSPDELESSKTNTVVTWDGPDDPEVKRHSPLSLTPKTMNMTNLLTIQNPLNFTPIKKVLVTFEIFLLNSTLYTTSSIYAPAIPQITSEYHTTHSLAALGTSLSILGYATGPMLWSPLSESPQTGRNAIYILTHFTYLLLLLPIIYAPNLPTILIFRFLSSFFSSPAQATGGATIADMYTPRTRTYGLALWELSTWIGPTLGPVLSGYAVEAHNWRWTIWALIWINGPMLLLTFCLLPETSASNILYRKAQRLRRSTGNASLKSETELRPQRVGKGSGGIIHETLVRPWVLSFQEPICLLLNAYTALICIIFFGFLESFPLVFGRVYSFSAGEVGLAFLGPLIGSIFATLIFVIWFYFSESKNFDSRERRKPEERFVPLMAGCFFIPASLFVFGWGARRGVHWIVPVVGSGLFSLGGFALFVSPRVFPSIF